MGTGVMLRSSQRPSFTKLRSVPASKKMPRRTFGPEWAELEDEFGVGQAFAETFDTNRHRPAIVVVVGDNDAVAVECGGVSSIVELKQDIVNAIADRGRHGDLVVLAIVDGFVSVGVGGPRADSLAVGEGPLAKANGRRIEGGESEVMMLEETVSLASRQAVEGSGRIEPQVEGVVTDYLNLDRAIKMSQQLLAAQGECFPAFDRGLIGNPRLLDSQCQDANGAASRRGHHKR